ncbi:MAG: helix-turn-helix transcriptional regulator [candidate division NC10 bacterium]|nr:helix-turn-helix transcriptional regulator [candidate division NC10 bacterium]
MVKAKKVGKTDFMKWIDRELERDRSFRQQVEEMLNGMRIEQDLIALREERGLTQARLAKMLGVSQPAIAKIESGRVKNLRLKTLVRVAAALGGELKLRIVRKQPKAKVVALHP